jgi:hypothetical protein
MARNDNRSGNRGGNRGGRNNNPSGRNQYSGGVMDLARDRPMAAAAVAAGAAAAGLFLWSRRSQISDQLSGLSEQIGDWSANMRSTSEYGTEDDTAGLTTSSQMSGRQRGMSETGGGNASLGARSGGGGSTSSASGRGRAKSTAATQQ